jgi:hypothetical protein
MNPLSGSSAGADPPPLRLERGEAWAQLSRNPDGDAVLEMGDRSHRWEGQVTNEPAVAAGSEWSFVSARLTDGASTVEVVAGGREYQAATHVGCWVAALPLEAVVAGGQAVLFDAGGQQLGAIELAPIANPPPRPAVAREELAPERAPVTLRVDKRRQRRRAFAVVCGVLALAAVNLALGAPWFALLTLVAAAGFGIMALLTVLPGVYDLHLDRDGLLRRGWLWRPSRFHWSDVAHFRPLGEKESQVGFDSMGQRRGGWSARLSAGMTGAHHVLPDSYGLSAVELAALMNAWREHHYPPGPPT